MRPVNVLIFPYRDQYFLQRYGSVVRDLQIIAALNQVPTIKQICIVNRPVSFYERFLGKHQRPSKYQELSKCRFWDTTSRDIVGPLSRRSWTERCYQPYFTEIRKWAGFTRATLNLLLDFTPIARIDYRQFPGYLIWYDVIDNFTRHNRFSKKQRQLVRQKYSQVKKEAHLVTGVTSEALAAIGAPRTMVIANGLSHPVASFSENGQPEFDLGFIGFITNKFDLDLVVLLADSGFRIAVFGEFYDAGLKKALAGQRNITLMGRYNSDQLPGIMKRFAIGLIPYRKEHSHDGSPIKLYQYLAYGKPVITSHGYANETDDKKSFVLITQGRSAEDIIITARRFLDRVNREGIVFATEIQAAVKPEMFWSTKVEHILKKIQKLAR